METSINGINLIKKFEPLRLSASKAHPSDKHFTIGYGHCSHDVRSGMKITEEKATELLRADLFSFEYSVNELKHFLLFAINQNQFDALVSFAFDMGAEQLNEFAGNDAQFIASEILEYCYIDGEKDPELVRRRRAERDLFLSDPDERPAAKPVETSNVMQKETTHDHDDSDRKVDKGTSLSDADEMATDMQKVSSNDNDGGNDNYDDDDYEGFVVVGNNSKGRREKGSTQRKSTCEHYDETNDDDDDDDDDDYNSPSRKPRPGEGPSFWGSFLGTLGEVVTRVALNSLENAARQSFEDFFSSNPSVMGSRNVHQEATDSALILRPGKSPLEIALEVISGVWGNGEERKRRLIEAGYDCGAVQAEISRVVRNK